MPNFKCELIKGLEDLNLKGGLSSNENLKGDLSENSSTTLNLNENLNLSENFKSPLNIDKVSFKALFKNVEKELFLLLCEFENEEFFIQISSLMDESLKNKSAFLIKADKHSKPAQIGFLQKALLTFQKHFCKNIINEALGLKPTRLITQSKFIENDTQRLLERLKKQERVFIEIGFGSGRHLLYQARKNPDALMLGIEIYTPAIEQVAKLAKALNLDNVLLTQNDARLLFSVLQSKSVDKIFLHFPVPWLKQPLRRVLSKGFVNAFLRVLKTGAEFELRTDSKEYFDFALELFLEPKKCELMLFKNQNLNITSKYEARWKRQEKDIYDIKLIKNLDFFENEALEKSEFKLINLSQTALKALKKGFKPCKFKEKDFFLSIESLYESLNLIENLKQNLSLTQQNFTQSPFTLMLKIAFGSFQSPQHSYILLQKNKSQFLFKPPFLTPSNLRALEKLNEFLSGF